MAGFPLNDSAGFSAKTAGRVQEVDQGESLFVQSQALPLSSCEALSELDNLSVPHLGNDDPRSMHFWSGMRIK